MVEREADAEVETFLYMLEGGATVTFETGVVRDDGSAETKTCEMQPDGVFVVNKGCKFSVTYA